MTILLFHILKDVIFFGKLVSDVATRWHHYSMNKQFGNVLIFFLMVPRDVNMSRSQICRYCMNFSKHLKHSSMWIPRDPTGNPGDSDRVFDPHRGIWHPNTDPLGGYLKKNILTQGNFHPNLKELLHIFSLFHLLLSISTHSPRDFLTGNSFVFVS